MNALRSSPSSPRRLASVSPHAVTQASTASACLRRLSLWVHSVSSCQACSRPKLLLHASFPVQLFIISNPLMLLNLVRASPGFTDDFGNMVRFYRFVSKFSLDNYGSLHRK